MLGLDLGAHSFKAVVAKAAGKGFDVARSAAVPAPAGGIAAPPAELQGALKELLKQLGPHPAEVAVAIAAQMALVRRLTLPKLPAKRLRALIENQAGQFIPFYREGVAFDLVVTNPNLSEKEQEVLLLAVPIGQLERLRAVLKTVGLRLAAVDLDQQALFRAGAATGDLSSTAVAAVLDVGHQGARLGLFQGGWPLLVRSLDSLPALAEATGSPETRIVAPESFAIEVRRTLEALLSQTKLPDLAGLVVANRWSDTQMTVLLSDELWHGLPGRMQEGFQVIDASGPALPKGMALAFGLSLSEAVRPFHPALLPRAPIEAQRQRRTATLALLASVIGVSAYGSLWWTDQQALAAESAQLQAQLAKPAAANEAEIAKQEGAWAQFQPLLESERVAPTWSTFYPHLKGLIPPGVTLQTVSASGASLAITGTASTAESMAAFVQNLYKSQMVEPPVLSNWAGEGGGQFSISGTLKPRAGVGK